MNADNIFVFNLASICADRRLTYFQQPARAHWRQTCLHGCLISSLRPVTILAAALAVAVPGVAQQRVTAADYARAEKSMTYNTTSLIFGWNRDVATGKETQLTKDGVKDF